MTTNTSTAEKSIVAELTFGTKTAKRVGWEAWEFTADSPNKIRVTNASWGHEKDDHSYLVTIEAKADGQLKPVECECKADQYRDDYDCKHKVALASIGGPAVLKAGIEPRNPSADNGDSTSQTLSDWLRTDGGLTINELAPEGHGVKEDGHPECNCTDFPDDLPCWPCCRDGRKDIR